VTGGTVSEHAHPNYYKVWAILCGLLVVSILGPTLGIKIVTLMTAFGIAIVKAWLVAANFMHLNIERRYVSYLLGTVLVFMLLFFAGTAPDVMKPQGRNWAKPAWLAAPAPPEHAAGH
jgi:caa(3)-type oxidase subunit IV